MLDFKRLSAAALCLGLCAATPAQIAGKLHWRNIGPSIGGRAVAVAGVPSDRRVFYMGSVQGGVWKSGDYGQNWTNITDGKVPGVANSIGALAVAPSNANVIYAGTGEADIRQDFDTGDGIYKTADGGKTWSYAGLRDTRTTARLVVDPRDPNVVYAASMGHVFAPNSQRGIFKTTDGGRTWRKALYVDAATGGIDLSMDPHNPRVLYAAMWQARRFPWTLVSGGPGSGLYKTTDGGSHWTLLSRNPGFAKGTLGRIGVSVSGGDSRVVYASVQAVGGGIFRSGDGGATWKHVNAEWKLRQRAFYYTAVFADPKNANVAYAPEVDGVFKTGDGGKTWRTISPGCDDHIVWIDPRDTQILLVGNDCGATVTVDGGQHWSDQENQPTGQYYHVALDDQFPFHVFGAAQDEGAFEGPSSALGGGITRSDWHAVALGESTFVAPDPQNPDVTYGSGYFSSFVRLDRKLGQEKNVSPWPRYMSGNAAAAMRYRFGWTHPIFFSPSNSNELLLAAQVVFSSTDRGQTWTAISPDLTRNEPSTEQLSGGPIYPDQSGAEIFPDIASLAVSPLDPNLLWAGSADGLVHVTKDHGATWTAVTPPQLPQWAQISSIEPSHTDKGTAYLSASRFQWDDYRPYVYRTDDYGAHWRAIASGFPQDQYVFAVRQDPREPRLLLAGTRSTVYASFDGGERWQPLTIDLPGVQVRDVAFDAREGEIVAATHGRAFWILDNLALLENLARQNSADLSAPRLFSPEAAWLTQAYGNSVAYPVPNLGENKAYGAAIFFTLPGDYDGRTPLSLSFVDSAGATVRSFDLHPRERDAKAPSDEEQANFDTTQQRSYDLLTQTAVDRGANEFVWDLRYPPAFDPPSFRTLGTDDWPDASDGPTVLPGDYTAVLRYGDRTLRQPLKVSLDPRIHPGPGELEARLAFEKKILATIDSLDRTIADALAYKRNAPASKRRAIDAAIGDLVMLEVRSSEADVIHPTKVREQLAFLMNSLETAYAKPTAAEYATYDELAALATSGQARLRALL